MLGFRRIRLDPLRFAIIIVVGVWLFAAMFGFVGD